MTYSEHYSRLGDIYAELGEIDGWYCSGNHDFVGWYRTRPGPGEWDGVGRPWALAAEYDDLRAALDRVLYVTVNYAPARWYAEAWTQFDRGEDGREWKGGESPTPDYGDLRAYAPVADIDLADGVKNDRPTGDLDRETVEAALTAYAEAFRDLAGSWRHVFALDSVGGAYLFVAPTATAPLAGALDRDARTLLFADMVDRLNEWLDGVREDVNDRMAAAEGYFEADLVNNKNRLYKAPLSVHSTLDGVVTPVDPQRPTYEYTPLAAVDGDTVARGRAWADEFTADHRDAVGSVVSTLWPDYAAETDGWRAAVRSRVDDLKAEREKRRAQARSVTAAEPPDDLDRTDDLDTLQAAIEAVDVRDVARAVADEWDTDPGRTPTRFDPPWRASDSGTSCFADLDKFVDLQEGANGGGALTLAARAAGILGHCSENLRGEDYWRAVNALRGLGFDIPYFTGSNGTHPDGLGAYEPSTDAEDARRKVLLAVQARGRD